MQPMQKMAQMPTQGQPSYMNTVPVGQPIPQGVMNQLPPQTRALAQIYQHNPQDARVMHLDPAMFGYAADNSGAGMRMPTPHAPQIHGSIGQQHGMASNYSTPIQGRQSPGFIPVQGSGFGPVGHLNGVQGASYNPIQASNYNPQQAQITF
jgi:hypothetical protein